MHPSPVSNQALVARAKKILKISLTTKDKVRYTTLISKSPPLNAKEIHMTKSQQAQHTALVFLLDHRGATVKEIGVALNVVKPLIADEIITVVGNRKHTSEDGTPMRGRPMFELALTSKGRKRAKRLAEKVAVAA